MTTQALTTALAASPRPKTIGDVRALVYRLAVVAYPIRDSKVITVDPLLTTLRSAIHTDLGGPSGKGGSAGSRLPLDPVSLELYEDITGQIETLYEGATGEPATETPEANLLDWWQAFDHEYRLDQISQVMIDVAATRLKSFATRIDHHLHPPSTVEGLVPCPACGATHALNGAGEQTRALVARFPRELTSLDEVTVECGSCGAVWEGSFQVEYLRTILDAAEPEEVDPDAEPAPAPKPKRKTPDSVLLARAIHRLNALLGDAEHTRDTLRTASAHLIHLDREIAAQRITVTELTPPTDEAPDQENGDQA